MTISFQTYLSHASEILQRVPLEPVERLLALLEQARDARQHIFLFGNGGSAATASHFACDLGKGTIRHDKPRFRVTALHDNLPTFSAYANDHGYDRVFAEPLINLAAEGDLAIAFSGSGNSPNVLRAVEEAKTRGLTTIGFTGFEGGALKDLVDLAIIVPSRNMGHIEDVHLALTHALCQALALEH
ncbi:MAG TPA: SIS domain-containing protein [Anaerolineae bacterium]|nr:SIS domain-containing protein [Anaerolineae bacterium]